MTKKQLEPDDLKAMTGAFEEYFDADWDGPSFLTVRNHWEAAWSSCKTYMEGKVAEECAKLADAQLDNTSMLTSMPPKSSAAWNIAAAIRAKFGVGK